MMRDGLADRWAKGLVCNRFSTSRLLYVNFWTKVVNRKKAMAEM